MYLRVTPRENAHHRKSKLGCPPLIYGLSNNPANLVVEGFFCAHMFHFRFLLLFSCADLPMTQSTPQIETLSPSRTHVILSLNPKAGRRSSHERAEILAETLRKGGLEVEILTDLALVAERANALHREGKLRALIGVGGDGTAAELTNRTEPGVPIALLPSGTANILAKRLKYSFDPRKFAKLILAGRVMEMDAVQANGRIFLVMIGCGFDAEVVNQVHAARMSNPKGAHINYLSYMKPIFRSIFSYRFPKVRIEFLDDAGDPTGETYDRPWAFICNIPKYGWGIPIAPGAKEWDGELNVCLWRGGSLWSGSLLSLMAQLGGLHRFWWRCTMRKGRNFRLTLAPGQRADAVVPFQLDGDPGGDLPVEVRILEKRLTVFVK